ncbi:hypothetical protein QMT05_21710 [Cronobacter malonaticus]|uniref:hypothetical protein n=1 Tax=Cronobacter malonaticus TaxID=413503 RepID=UPI0024C245E9|nr:hypothetical protein [Cronobacter malonaticus]MDK1178708.1 hypothetical protein [Cronobacter malonaticus]MDK1689573.1 hypothetical protein [Cronobacter malonaticus]
MNNDELIAAGHELAKCLDSNTPLLDIAKMIVRLADKLDVTTLALREKMKQCNELANELNAVEAIHNDAVFITDEHYDQCPPEVQKIISKLAVMVLPATDAFLREVKSQARKDGAHFVANRMLAAWDAGFIDDTAENAADIARMILSSTEFMADAPEGDFDRAFADSVLVEIASELRQGGAA